MSVQGTAQDYEVRFTVIVRVRVNDPSVIDRCVTNEDGWRDQLYPLHTAADVVEHLARNMGIRDCRLSQLDGWADLPDGAADAEIAFLEAESVEQLGGRS